MHAIALRLPLLLVAGLPIQAFAADTQLQTVTVQASASASEDDALPTRPPTSVYGLSLIHI